MDQGATRSAAGGRGNGSRRQRLTAEARKRSILDAARRAFSETGDVKGTTIRAIAEEGGISEGVIYRHFESKDQLFLEAVVEPLREAVDDLVAAVDVVGRGGPLSPERRSEAMHELYRQLTATFDEILPLLGLVLFGDPEVAERFYRENLAAAMDRLAAAWQQVAARHSLELASPGTAARAVMGMALMAALEGTYAPGSDRDHTLDVLARGTISGFFPSVEDPRPVV